MKWWIRKTEREKDTMNGIKKETGQMERNEIMNLHKRKERKKYHENKEGMKCKWRWWITVLWLWGRTGGRAHVKRSAPRGRAATTTDSTQYSTQTILYTLHHIITHIQITSDWIRWVYLGEKKNLHRCWSVCVWRADMAALSGGEMCVKYLMFAFNLVFWVSLTHTHTYIYIYIDL